MITLLADHAYPPYAAALEAFGRLAGLWETEITYYPADGSAARHAAGEWEFGYALEGRAVLDVWLVPARRLLAGAERAPGQECGLCVRIWDPRLALWRFTFHSTATGVVIHMYARPVGDELVLERAEGGQLVRWIFSEIAADTFAWRSERTADGGRWRVEQTVRARRATPNAAPNATPNAAGRARAAVPPAPPGRSTPEPP